MTKYQVIIRKLSNYGTGALGIECAGGKRYLKDILYWLREREKERTKDERKTEERLKDERTKDERQIYLTDIDEYVNIWPYIHILR